MIDYKSIVKSREVRLAILRALSFVPDRPMISVLYRLKTGHTLHLKEPKRYTEKLQWYKLNYHDPLMIRCVDKYDVRKYVEDCGLESILNECYGVYDRPEQVDLNLLPERFVLKDTLGSGGNAVLICDKGRDYDEEKIRKIMAGWVAMNPRSKSGGREWPYYSGKKHRIVAERFIDSEAEQGGLIDYKFFCFDGRAEFMYGIADRVVGKIAGFGIFDRDFNLTEYTRPGENPLSRELNRPENFEEMRTIAEKLSAPFPHARVDLYNQDGRILFGELTFYSGSGYIRFLPDEFDLIAGAFFHLPDPK